MSAWDNWISMTENKGSSIKLELSDPAETAEVVSQREFLQNFLSMAKRVVSPGCRVSRVAGSVPPASPGWGQRRWRRHPGDGDRSRAPPLAALCARPPREFQCPRACCERRLSAAQDRDLAFQKGLGQKRALSGCTRQHAADRTHLAEGCEQRSRVLSDQVSRCAGKWAAGKPREVPSPPSHPRPTDSSPSEFSNYKAIPSYSELFAASVGNVDWLRFCLNREHKEITVDDKGFTAIHFAALRSKLSCLRVLIEEYKFPVDLPTNNGQTPLHLVIRKDNRSDILPCIDYLLKKGAAINSQTCHGSTPLHLAARNGLLGCVKVLVQSGANVHARDAIGFKPIDHCKLWNHRSCARFLKDAMWKQNKKDFAREMGKLKTLKGKLAILEYHYLTEYQREQQILRKARFRTWLQSKLPGRPPSSADSKQVASVGPWSLALFKTLRPQFAKSFLPYPSVEAQLKSLPSPVVPPKPIYKHQTTISRPKLWNFSSNLASSPVTKIDCPQGIRLGVYPDPCKEHDFCRFLEMTRNSLGGACLYTADNHLVTPVPHLPFEVMAQVLYPGAQPYRMKVPQGLYPLDILKVPQKRRLGDACSNTLAMSLRETFDEPFLATLGACPKAVAPPSKGVLT